MNRRMLCAVVLALSLCAQTFGSTTRKGESISPDDLIARHLESIGPAASLEDLKSFNSTGRVILDLLVGGSGHLEGVSQIVSQGHQNSVVFDFGNANYGEERLVFDGDKTDASFISPGNRSPLGEFIFTYRSLLSEGLFGGVLSTAWPLLEVDERQPKLKVKGLKKADDQQLWELEYRLRKGGRDLTIRLYFDAETFRHVKSTYDVTISSGLGSTPEESARLRQTRLKLTEEFGEFRAIHDLTLPTEWTITYNEEGTGRGRVWKWTVYLQNVQTNQLVPPEQFQLQ